MNQNNAYDKEYSSLRRRYRNRSDISLEKIIDKSKIDNVVGKSLEKINTRNEKLEYDENKTQKTKERNNYSSGFRRYIRKKREAEELERKKKEEREAKKKIEMEKKKELERKKIEENKKIEEDIKSGKKVAMTSKLKYWFRSNIEGIKTDKVEENPNDNENKKEENNNNNNNEGATNVFSLDDFQLDEEEDENKNVSNENKNENNENKKRERAHRLSEG